MGKSKRIVIGWATTCVLFALAALVSGDAAIVAAPILIVGLSYCCYRQHMWALIPAVLVSAAWMSIGGHMYTGYGKFSLMIAGVSAYPMVMWPCGLFLFYLLCYRLASHGNWAANWITLAVTYSLGVIAAEYVGYNILGVHLQSGTKYAGWPILNIFHCPWWMCVAYFANGIAFSGLVTYWMHRRRIRAQQEA